MGGWGGGCDGWVLCVGRISVDDGCICIDDYSEFE